MAFLSDLDTNLVGAKPLSAPVMTEIFDANMRCKAKKSPSADPSYRSDPTLNLDLYSFLMFLISFRQVVKQCLTLSSPGWTAKPVNLTYLYEAFCPFCQQFVIKQLKPTWDLLEDSGIFHVELVPFGNAMVTTNRSRLLPDSNDRRIDVD